MSQLDPASLAAAIQAADLRTQPHLRTTPLEWSPWLSRVTGGQVHLKLENLQLTGSFKIRGALNRVLQAPERSRFVTASTGNHGAAMAHAVQLTQSELTVFVPETADSGKVERLRSLGVGIRIAGTDCTDTEIAARNSANESESIYVSPYNDPEIVAGQGTLGLAIARQLPEVDTVLVALGGGGLASGCAAALKSHDPKVQVVACSPKASAVMMASVEAGRILDLESAPTLSDGTAGGVEEGSITFELCRNLLDQYVSVSESEIASALLSTLEEHHTLVEGAAAVAVASALSMGKALEGRNVVVILCGANIAIPVLSDVLTKSLAQTQQPS